MPTGNQPPCGPMRHTLTPIHFRCTPIYFTCKTALATCMQLIHRAARASNETIPARAVCRHRCGCAHVGSRSIGAERILPWPSSVGCDGCLQTMETIEGSQQATLSFETWTRKVGATSMLVKGLHLRTLCGRRRGERRYCISPSAAARHLHFA
jgi:hypothetical protein